MKRLTVFFVFILFFMYGHTTVTQAEERGAYIKSRSIKTQNFSFHVPTSWQAAPSNQLKKMKREMFEVYGDVTKMIPEFFVFDTGKDCIVYIYEVKLPQEVQTLQYIDTLFKDNEVKFQWGVEQGIVRELVKHEKTQISDIPVLASDSILVKGELNRLSQYNFHSPSLLSSSITIQTFCSQEGFSSNQDAISQLLETLQISGNK